MTNTPAVHHKTLNPYVQLRVGHKPIGDGKSASPFIKRDLLEILTIAYFDMGSGGKLDDTMMQSQIDGLFKELSGKYSLMTLPEVKEAFRRGIRGESGPYFGLCPKTYNQFLKWYFELPDRNNAWQAHLTELSQQKDSEKKIVLTIDQLRQACIDAFEDYKNSGKMPFVPFAIYNQIKELKGVKTIIADGKWAQIKKDGIELYKKRQTHGMTSKNADKFLRTFIFDNEDLNQTNTIKEVALRAYFEELIFKGEELRF